MSQQYLMTGICCIWTVCSDLTYSTSKSAHVASVRSIDRKILPTNILAVKHLKTASHTKMLRYNIFQMFRQTITITSTHLIVLLLYRSMWPVQQMNRFNINMHWMPQHYRSQGGPKPGLFLKVVPVHDNTERCTTYHNVLSFLARPALWILGQIPYVRTR